MSDKRDKPTEPDPDATVSIQRSSLAVGPDPDATVALQRSSLMAQSDPDATVAMQRSSLLPATDPDATVSLQRSSLTARPEEDAAAIMPVRPAVVAAAADESVMMPAGGSMDEPVAAAVAAAPAAPSAATGIPSPHLRGESDPETTFVPAQAAAAPVPGSRMPWIAGAVVLVIAGIFFALNSGKEPAPTAPKVSPGAAATPAQVSTPAVTPPAAGTPPAVTAPAAGTAPAAAMTPTAAAPAAAATAPAAQSTLQQQLAAEIKRGQIVLAQDAGATSITLRNEHQFASGSVDPEAVLRPLILSIAAALDKVPGAIVVTGHADAAPSTNPRFTSNAALSSARAGTVAKLMATKLADPQRLRSEGAADASAIAPNDTADNRAKNRRVVIVLKHAP